MKLRLLYWAAATVLASSALAEPVSAPLTVCVAAERGGAASILTLSTARTTTGDDLSFQMKTEAWTLTRKTFDDAPSFGDEVLWRDERTWWSLEVSVEPAVGRLLFRPAHRDAIVVLTWIEGSRGGVVACADVFKVPLAATTAPTTPAASPPMARLVRPTDEGAWRHCDVLVGDEAVMVVPCTPAARKQAFVLDLETAEWREATMGEASVPGIVGMTRIAIDPATGMQHPMELPMSRPTTK